MTVVLSKISNFGHSFNLLISNMEVNYECPYGIMKCSFAFLKNFLKFEMRSKFCQNFVKIRKIKKFQILAIFLTFSYQTRK